MGIGAKPLIVLANECVFDPSDPSGFHSGQGTDETARHSTECKDDGLKEGRRTAPLVLWYGFRDETMKPVTESAACFAREIDRISRDDVMSDGDETNSIGPAHHSAVRICFRWPKR